MVTLHTPAAVRVNPFASSTSDKYDNNFQRHSKSVARDLRLPCNIVDFFTRPATLPHPPHSGLLLARLVFTVALLGPLTTTPAYFADLARLNSSADRYNNPCPDCSNIRPAISPGYVGSPFGALPFTKRPPRLFMCLLALVRLGCSLRPFGLFTRPDPAPPRIGSAAPGHNSARGPFASF